MSAHRSVRARSASVRSDSIACALNFGDVGSGVSNLRTASATSHHFTAAGTYTVSLTATDRWGKFTTITKDVTLSAP